MLLEIHQSKNGDAQDRLKSIFILSILIVTNSFPIAVTIFEFQ
jgi:hypothetical protein